MAVAVLIPTRIHASLWHSLTSRFIGLNINPTIYHTTILEMSYEMVISLILGRMSPINDRDNFLIKATLEGTLPITPNPSFLKILLNFVRRDRIFVLNMLSKTYIPIEKLLVYLIALGFVLEVIRVVIAFPISFTRKFRWIIGTFGAPISYYED
jgi:hypothetical protein